MPPRRRNLELDASLSGNADATLFAVLDSSVTAMGARAAAALAQPTAHHPRAAAAALSGDRRPHRSAPRPSSLRALLQGSRRRRAHPRARGAALRTAARPDAAAQLARRCCRAVRAALATLDSPLLQRAARARRMTHEEVCTLLTAAIAAEPGTLVRDGDVIAAGYDAELDELRRIATHTDEFLLELEQRERERTGLAEPQARLQPRAGLLHRDRTARRGAACPRTTCGARR